VSNINGILTNCSIVSTTSDITTHNLYIKSLKESLAAAQEYVAKERIHAQDKLDLVALMHTKLNAQCQ
jgi:hypothetical protein